MADSNKSILFAGYKLGDPKKTGGFIVYTENILQDLRELGIEHELLNTNSQFFKNFPHMFLNVTYNFFKKFRKYDHISLHGTANHFLFFGPIFVFFSKKFGKTISLKKTAGRFHTEYEAYGPFRKKLIQYVLKNADIVYFETKYLVDYFKHFNKETYWHPNIRRNPNFTYKQKEYRKKFAFISLVTETKGIDELLEVSNRLDDTYTIDIYGPVKSLKYTEEYFKDYKANFKGSLASHEVIEKLKEYDVIVLPSHDEGYPGIFIEAFSYGLPVLTTSLPPILEIVKHEQNGIIVEPKNIDSLYEGFLAFNTQNYTVMSKNSYDSFEQFDSLKQTQKLVNRINALG
jgi:glycosyltransferase involved in cell wall biosynthesis